MKFFFIILYLLANISYSQNKFEVIDKDTKTSIEYATILFYNSNKFIDGTYSESNGSFILPTGIDKISISCIGYESKIIENVINTDKKIIELEKKAYVLDEIIVSNIVSKIGSINKKKSNDIGVSKGLEIGSYIENNLSKECKIKNIKFKINKIEEDINYRIHLYNSNNDNYLPSDELIKNNIILTLKKGSKGMIVINLEDENIILPKNGFFITIECLSGKTSPKNKYVLTKKETTFNIEAHKSDLHHYVIKNSIKGVGWINYNNWMPNNYKLTFKKEYAKDKLFVPSFGVDLIEIE
jgi:hypothetical protein